MNCRFIGYTLGLFSQNFKPRLVMPKFQASISAYRAAKLPPLQPTPCYPEIFKIYLCLVVHRQLPPSQPVPCYSKITTRVKTPTSCEIPTREILVIPLNQKNRLAQNGGCNFVTYPTFRISASLSHGSPLPSHPPTEAAKTRDEAPHPTPSTTQPVPLPRRCRPQQHLDVPHPPYRMRICRRSRRPAGSATPSSTSKELPDVPLVFRTTSIPTPPSSPAPPEEHHHHRFLG